MANTYNSAELYTTLLRARGNFRNIQRAAIPYVFTVGKEYYVVQPGGFCHVTNPDLHEFNGVWNKKEFNRGDYDSVVNAAATSAFAITSPKHVHDAMAKFKDAVAVGWCPSISIINICQLPTAAYGSYVKHRWGSLEITPERNIFVMPHTTLNGKDLILQKDGYLEERSSFKLWHQLGNRSISGEDLLDKVQTVSPEQLEPAIAGSKKRR